MSTSSRPQGWLRSLRRNLTAKPSRKDRKTQLKFTLLEDRVTPANVLANTPENNQSTLTANFTQSETGSIAFGNTVIVAYNDSGSNAGGSRFTGYSRSTDGGATFTDMGALTSQNNDAGDPVLARDEVSGRIYLATLGFTTAQIQVFRSNDNGLTFGAAVPAFTQAGASMDKEWIAVDNFAGAGQGNVYLIGRDFGTSGAIVFTRSTDGGSTWSAPISIVSGNQGAFVAVNADHSVNVYWLQSGSPQSIRTRRSTDGGVTFGATTTVANLLTTGTNGDMGLTRSVSNSASFRSNAFPSVAVNPTQPGVIYAAYADNPAGADKADVFFTQSNDFGATWSSPIVVNTDATGRDQWQPSIRVTPNGQRLSISWYDRRLDANNALIDYYARSAMITGTTTTFGPDSRITDTSFLPDFGRDGVVNGVYMGDYDQGAATNNRFYYVWADNRLGGPDIRVSAVPIVGGGPIVFSATPTGVTTNPTPIDITFDQAMDPTSFSIASDVLLFTRDGTDVKSSLTGFSWINGNTTLRLTSTASFPGAYVLRLGVNILSATGFPMDNNVNGTPGEIPGDEFQMAFIVPSPSITSSTPSGAVSPPVTSMTFNFSQVMDTTSFSVAQDVFSFTGPAGNLIPFISGFTWVTNQQLRIDMASQTIPGAYTMVLNPTILSPQGVQLDNNGNGTAGEIPGDRYTATFSIGGTGSSQNSFGYRFSAFPFNSNINLVPGAPGVTTLNFVNSQDDDTTTVSLNGNTFNFYGTNFTSVNVGTNGNIQFGGAVTDFTNTDLTTSPAVAMFAGFWDDLHVGRNTATDDVVLAAFQDVTGDGQPDLIVSWRNAHYFAQSPVTDDGITLQLVLQLNTGSVAGAMISNFVDLDSDNSASNTGGISATVGIKNAGSTPATGDPLVAAFNGNNPSLVGSNKAIRFFKNSPPVANANGPYNVASGTTVALSSAGTSDPEGDPLTLIWDLDGDGTFGETGAGATRGDEVGASPTFNAAGLAAGAYQVALRAFDTSGDVGNATATVNVTAGAPSVTGVNIGNGNGSAQRSMVNRLVVSFNQVITFAGAPTSAFTLVRTVGGVPTGAPLTFTVSAIDNSTGFSRVTVTPTSNLDGISLADAHYRLTVVASQVLTGGTPMAADSVTNFHRFFGDVNGDQHVDILDYGIFGTSYLKNTGDPGFLDYLDKDNNGHVDIFDYGQFGIRYLTVLP